MTIGMRLVVMVVFFATVVAFTNPAQATIVQENEAEVGQVELQEAVQIQPLMGIMGVTPGKLLGAKQFQLNQIFAIEIQRLTKVCGLNEAQKSKLTVGAKGVVKKVIEEFRTDPSFSQFVPPPKADQAGEQQDIQSVEIDEVKDFNDVDQFAWQMIDIGNSPEQMFQQTPPNEHALWLKVVSSTLTSEQQQKLDEFRRQEKKAIRALMLETGIELFSTHLALRDEQKTPFKELVEKELDRFDKLPVIYRSFQFLFTVASLDSKELKKILDDSQYNYLQIVIAPMKEMVEAMKQSENQEDEAPEHQAEEIK